MDISVERFRALARSSPWRWSTLRFVLERDPAEEDREPIRVLVRRPERARVEGLDGTLLGVHRDQPQTVSSLYRRPAWPLPSLTRRRPRQVALPGPDEVEVDQDADGLVWQRPWRWDCDTDTAMLRSYYDIAMLDPVELADGHDDQPGATIDELRAVEHRGREAWEAVLRATASYDPRCTCCPLLDPGAREQVEAAVRELDPGFAFPEAHRVRLDVGTGVCVSVEQLGGTRAGRGHVLAIETVDERMGDELFPTDTRRRRGRAMR